MISTIKNAPMLQTKSTKMLAGATLWSATQICSYGSRPIDLLLVGAGGLAAPIREKLSGISENRISSAPDASVERIHLYSIDAALADRVDSDTAVGRNISAPYGAGSWIHDAQFGSECVIARNG